MGVLLLVGLAAPWAGGAALDGEMNALRMAGWEAAYSTDYEAARAKFAELQRRLPAHPVGDLSMASIVWQEYLFRIRRLQSGLYRRDSGFYAGPEGDSVDREVEAAFQEHLGRAMTKAQAMADANPGDAEALYFLGSVYGVRAAYAASAQRRFWAALRDGVKSVKLHRKAVSLDPAFYDAYLTLGTYHYAVGCIPQPLRAIATVAGIRGGRRKGIAELEIAAKKGTYNRDDATALLIALYRFEGDAQQALAALEGYAARYPRNALLRLEMGSTLAQLGRMAESHAAFETVLKGTDRRVIDLAHYQYGEALAMDRAYLRAAEQFAAVEETAGANAALVTQALLRAGQMYDLAGQRAEAIGYYRKCLGRPGGEELRKSAERGMKKPYSVSSQGR